MKRVTINPITRLEGHGKIEIFLDEEGNVANTYLQVPELRGFERFCVGRRAEEMPVITSRICGVCPEAHHMAAVKALDQVFAADPPSAARKIRELLYMAFFVVDHTTHFYALGGPDFIVGPDAPPQERNILGVIRKVGQDIGKSVIECRARNHEIIKMIGGRGVHPSAGIPGGWSKAITPEERELAAAAARKNIDFAVFSLKVFQQVVWENATFRAMVESDAYLHRTHYMGTVDARNRANFYDGHIRVVDPDGREFARYPVSEYLDHVAEHVEPWTYMKFPFLKKIGWTGFTEGAESGVYAATPLGRLNASDGLTTPLAQEQFETFYESFGSKKREGRYTPIHHQLATHWARLIEMLFAAERMLELANDPEITSPEVRQLPTRTGGVGIGSVEAPRGTLVHHYETDDNGLIRKVNLIVGTTNNHAAISMSIKKAAQHLIRAGQIVEEGLLNRIEMAFRLYDPCMSCATHAFGVAPLTVTIRDSSGEELRTIVRGE